MAVKTKKIRIHQVGDNAHADKSGVRDNVPSRGRRVAGNVHLGIHKAFGKAAEDADKQVEDAGDSRKALGCSRDFTFYFVCAHVVSFFEPYR